MFPVFPVRFPVSSQFPASGFMVFPAFPGPAARAMSAISCNPFLHAGNTGNSGHRIELERLPNRARWNRRGTTGNRSVEGLFQGWTSMSITHYKPTRRSGSTGRLTLSSA
jgi:hypothetical protein